jgi:CubicO group peptidase (beta-lactamase class C family)/surfactin synthase thioesterase subunit
VLIASIAALVVVGAAFQAIATQIDRRNYPAPGEMVDVGGYSLHLFCVGENNGGRPTVILESSLGGTSSVWAWIQPEIAKSTRVCAYDRAGMGWSEPSPEPRDAQIIAKDLHTLLQNANIPGPYVLVGWSFGGLYMRAYASEYPDEVAGLALLDSSSPEQCTSTPGGQAQCAAQARMYSIAPVLVRMGVMRVMGLFQPASGLPALQSGAIRASFSATKDMDAQSAEFLASPGEDVQNLNANSFGDIPLLVLTATEHGTPPDLEQLWQTWQAGFTALSTNSLQHIMPGATHSSIVLDSTDAKVSANAILQVVEAAHSNQPLDSMPAVAVPSQASSAADFAAIDAYVEKRMKDLRIPGLSLGIVHGDEIVYLKGFGDADPSGRAVTPQTPFIIGSLSKSFTALAVMQRVEAGQIDLDAPVQRYLPWFRVADEAASAEITVRHLLNQTSGLSTKTGRGFQGNPDTSDGALESAVRSLQNVELAGAVGETYQYSTVNYAVLGLIVQSVSGGSFEEYVQEHIFGPLEMRTSYTSQPEAQAHGLASGYRYWFGFPVAADLPFNRSLAPAGYLISSGEDMAHFLIAQLNDGRYVDEPLISPQGIATMHQPAVSQGDDESFYGMGWKIGPTSGVPTVWHDGSTFNYYANMTLVPAGRWGIVIMQNSYSFPDEISGAYQMKAFADGLTALVVGKQPSPPPASTPLFVLYGFLLLVVGIQVTGMLRSLRALRRWRLQPETRPGGKMWPVFLPLAWNLIWAIIVLVILPKGFGTGLSVLVTGMPDVGLTLVASGLVAIVWGLARTVMAFLALRKVDARSLSAKLIEAHQANHEVG